MSNFLFQSALAQDSAVAPTTSSTSAGNGSGNPPAPSPFTSLMPFALIFLVFYFLLIRPQKKKLQEEQNFVQNLGKDNMYCLGALGCTTENSIYIFI